MDFQLRHGDEFAQCVLCKTGDSTVQFLGVVLDMPVFVRVETVQKTVEIPQFQVIWFCTRLLTCPFSGTTVLVETERQNSGSSAGAPVLDKIVHMPVVVFDFQRVGKVVDVPVLRVVQVSQEQVVMMTVVIPQLHLVEKSL